jgi:hypothetical protein
MTDRGNVPSLGLVVGAGAILAAVLLVMFRERVLEAFALPAAWLWWLLSAAAVVIGQRLVWAAAVLLFALVTLAALRASRRSARRPAPPVRPERMRSRLAHWESILALDRGNAAGRSLVVLELRALALSVLCGTENQDRGELEARIAAGDPSLPEPVRVLFGRELTGPSEAGHGWRRGGRGHRRPALAPLPLAQVVDALEARLDSAAERRTNGGDDAD